MGLWQSFLVALDMLRTHKLRALLTMLGVIIGVFSVTIIVMISNGFQAYMNGQFNQFGADTIYLFFDPGRQRGQSLGSIDGLRMDDVTYLRERIPALDIISPMTDGGKLEASHEGESLDKAALKGVDEYYLEMSNYEITQGRSINKADLENLANVCVIGDETKNRLFKAENPLGKIITFRGLSVEVVGVMKKHSAFGDSNEFDVLVPLSTFQKKWSGDDRVMFISMRPKEGEKVKVVMDRVWEAMMARSNNKRLYRLDSNESVLQVLNGIFGMAGIMLAGIAALSLLVGGIGIMNIMLVSVTERTKEIGLRKAIGARSGTVLSQFLVESATLSLVGGIIGMTFAWIFGQLVQILTASLKFPTEEGLATPFPITAAIGAAIFSAFIGVVFGLYPAYRASRLSPIDALRTE
ncbi:MAG: ABC transporter permease [Fimbriimonadaceae bacterium]|nr:ABC transporter permease [Fimbriimonadaceae bacterium]